MRRATSRCTVGISRSAAPRQEAPHSSHQILVMDDETSTQRIVRHYEEVDEASRLQQWMVFQLEASPHSRIDTSPSASTHRAAIVDSRRRQCNLCPAGWPLSAIRFTRLIPLPSMWSKARQASARQPEYPLASAEIGDARALPRARRGSIGRCGLAVGAALSSRRAIRPPGLLAQKHIAFCVLADSCGVLRSVTSHALFDSLAHGFFDDPDFAPIVASDLENGQHRNSTENPMCFTRRVSASPRRIVARIAGRWVSGGCDCAHRRSRLACPGFRPSLWNDPIHRQRLLPPAIRCVERELPILGATSHIMAVGRK